MRSEFAKFIQRGNVIDLAVGIVIGVAFTSVVNSFVGDMLMPPIGLITGGVDFSNLFVDLSGEGYASLAAAQEAGAPTLNYGLFINNLIVFLIVAFAVFLLVQAYNRLREREDAEPVTPTDEECPFCRLRIPLSATRCGHCTSTLPDRAPAV